MQTKKQNLLKLVCFAIAIAVFGLSATAVLAMGYSSDSYNLKVEDLDSLGGESQSANYNEAQALNNFATGKFESSSWEIKAGYLYFKPPDYPIMEAPGPVTSSSIQWNFIDQAEDEQGFFLEDLAGISPIVVSDSNISSINETGLAENSRYTRTVKAYNPFGDSKSSDPATACTLVGARALQGSPGTSFMDLYMSAFPRHDYGDSAYTFRLVDGDSSGWQSGDETWRNTGLTANTQYTWGGNLRNICGDETGEVYLTACTLANTPGAPLVSYTETSPGQYDATVTISTNGNPVGTEYAVTVNGSYLQADGSVGGGPFWSTALTRIHTSLQEGSIYVYRVVARNCDSVNSAFSLPTSLLVGDLIEISPPEELISTLPSLLVAMLEDLLSLLERFLNNALVQLLNQTVLAPALLALALANLLLALGVANLASLFNLLWQALSEPFLLLAGKRRRMWGVVYHSMKKVPVDLALVRLLDAETGKLVQTRVTDRKGRFAFLIDPGKYKVTVTKQKFTFPSKKVAGKTHDAGYDDLYFGEPVEIANEKTVLTISIPIDPIIETEAMLTDKAVLWRFFKRRVSIVLAFVGPVFSVIVMWISPNLFTFLLLVAHILIFALFARIVFGKKSKPWGVVYDSKTHKPIGLAVVRIFNRKYDDLLETQVTDRGGRFGFLVGMDTYRVTADKEKYKFPSLYDKGFHKYKGEDFTVKKDELVKFDIPLDPGMKKGKKILPPDLPRPENVSQVETKKRRDLGELGGPDS
ncbi:hypothetical protein ACFL2B_00035 [Patescibacteria group bacterium]